MKIDLDRLEELERKATPEPWEVDEDVPPEALANRMFLATLRNAAPALIAAARLADAQARELAALTDHIRALCALRDKDAKTIAALRATCREVAGELRKAVVPWHLAPWTEALAARLDPPAQGTETK